MRIGVWIIATDRTIDPAVLARRAEELGFSSFWAPEQLAVPVNMKTGWRRIPGEPFPDEYHKIMDPFIILSRVSAATSTIRLGTGVCQVPHRHPLLLGKEVATLDFWSGGRVILGIGAAWLREESELVGVDFDRRWGWTRESILAMKELWTKDEAEFHGKYYDFPPVFSWPKPARKPHPPVILGGMAKNVLQRVAAWGDGWMPNRITPEQIKASRATLDELATTHGRDPGSIEITIFGRDPDNSEISNEIRSFEEAGADGVVVRLPGTSTEDAASRLEGIAGKVLG